MARTSIAAGPSATFDDQATDYDERTGLPAWAGATVAQAILAHAGADGLVVELGAGTGEIGTHLAGLPQRYVGLDASPTMLTVFHAKAGPALPSLVVSDCNGPWPLDDGEASVVFASRVIHLLQPDHAVRETWRVCRRGGFLMLGRVLRDPDSIKQRLRRRRQELLAERGIEVRQGEDLTRRVVERCREAGAEPLGRKIVATWQGQTTPVQIIAGWERLSRMGSAPIDAATRGAILAELRCWARMEFGDPAHAETFQERYAMDVVRLP